MLGGLKLKAALRVRTMVDPHIQAGHRQPLVGDALPRLPDIAKLHVGRGKAIREQTIAISAS
jgi:hypothetical protein